MFNPYRFPIQNIIGLNNALGDKLNTSEVAEEFDSTKSYAVGAYCLYQGVLYKFTSAHSGAWDAADVIPVSVMGEIAGGGASPYTSNPEMDGIASPGSAPEYARGNHVHPSDTGKADKTKGFKAVSKTWSRVSSPQGDRVWHDGDDVYYSDGYSYKLNKSTSEWEPQFWLGSRPNDGSMIWTDGDTFYYSAGNNQYYLDKAHNKWSNKTWNGFSNDARSLFYGDRIWTDGEDIYWSFSTIDTYNYKLDKTTSTWSEVTWNGCSAFNGYEVWTDGENIYLSRSSDGHYVLNKATNTWESKTWNGFSAFNGHDVWTDGEDIYVSEGSSEYQYILNKETDTWVPVTWEGCSNLYGYKVWTDGANYYYSYGSGNQFELIHPVIIEDAITVYPNGDIKAAGEVEDGGDNVLSEKYDANSLAFQNYRVEIPASGWSSTAVDGFYTQTITLPYPINTYKEVDINPTGASDGTDQTSAEAVAYSCLKHVKYAEGTGVTSATLYASTKPTTTFYAMVSGYYMTKNAATSGVAQDITTANKLNVYDANGTKVAEFNGSATVNIYYRSKIASVPYTGWSSVVDANGYYTQSIDLVDNYNSYDTPDVYLCGSTNDTEATATEQAAWSLINRVWMADSTATHTLILYAKTKPTTTFYIRVKGSYIG